MEYEYKFKPSNKTAKVLIEESKEQYFYFNNKGMERLSDGCYRSETKKYIASYY